jgi:hypothetical protein
MTRAKLVILMLVMASCGVPIERSAQPIDLTDIVLEVAAPSTIAMVPMSPDFEGPETRAVVIYLIRGQGLLGRARSISTNYEIMDLLDLLAAGPAASDFLDDLSTGLISAKSVVDSAEIRDGLAFLALNESFLNDTGTNQILVLGQIVITLLSNLPISGVQFTSSGQPIAVPNASGKPVTEPVRRRDYASLLSN